MEKRRNSNHRHLAYLKKNIALKILHTYFQTSPQTLVYDFYLKSTKRSLTKFSMYILFNCHSQDRVSREGIPAEWDFIQKPVNIQKYIQMSMF